MKKRLSLFWRHTSIFRGALRRFSFIALSLLLAVGLLQLTPQAAANQLLTRSLSISSAVASGSSTYTFTFTTQATGAVQSMTVLACTTALGSCTGPAGFSFSPATFGSQNGWQGGNNFSIDNSGSNGCTASTNNLCVRRVDSTAQTATSRSISFDSVTNPNTSNTSFYLRINTYSDAGFTTLSDYGTVATATSQTLTANASVEELLNFCVGSTAVDDATTAVSSSSPDYCTGISGSSVDLGTLGNSNVAVSPVAPIDNGNSKNGVVMINTNASNGASVSYDAIQQSGTNHKGTLRVAGASCNGGSVSIDPCINSIGGTQASLTANTENFGMTIAGVNCGIASNYYTCNFSGGIYNLVRAANYNPTGSNTFDGDAGQISGTTAGSYAWDESGSPVQVASSSSIVGYEALIIKFAAAAALTTPTGSYTALADFIAVATY